MIVIRQADKNGTIGMSWQFPAGKKIYYGGTQIKRCFYRTSPNGNYTMVYQWDNVAPIINLNYPLSTIASKCTISGTVTDTESGVASIAINEDKVSCSENNFSYSTELANGNNEFNIVAIDNAGNTKTQTISVYKFVEGTGTWSGALTHTTNASAYTPGGWGSWGGGGGEPPHARAQDAFSVKFYKSYGSTHLYFNLLHGDCYANVSMYESDGTLLGSTRFSGTGQKCIDMTAIRFDKGAYFVFNCGDSICRDTRGDSGYTVYVSSSSGIANPKETVV